jgi:hypothetical protein
MEEQIYRGMIWEEMRHIHTHRHTNKCKNGRRDKQRK